MLEAKEILGNGRYSLANMLLLLRFVKDIYLASIYTQIIYQRKVHVAYLIIHVGVKRNMMRVFSNSLFVCVCVCVCVLFLWILQSPMKSERFLGILRGKGEATSRLGQVTAPPLPNCEKFI